MANQWFKMYGVEMLADPKIQRLTASERSCWLTLLCLASIDDGVIDHCEEEYLMKHSGIEPLSSEWGKTHGILVKFEMLGMIEVKGFVLYVKNWQKRQSRSDSTERVRKWREKQRLLPNPAKYVTHVTLQSNGRREEKRREEKDISQSKLQNARKKLEKKGIISPKPD